MSLAWIFLMKRLSWVQRNSKIFTDIEVKCSENTKYFQVPARISLGTSTGSPSLTRRAADTRHPRERRSHTDSSPHATAALSAYCCHCYIVVPLGLFFKSICQSKQGSIFFSTCQYMYIYNLKSYNNLYCCSKAKKSTGNVQKV